MQDLPADLVRAVLSLLDTRDVARAACACRALRVASEQVQVDVGPTRRRDDIVKFAERRARFVRSFVARRADAAAMWPAFENLRDLKLRVGACWTFVDLLPRRLETLECAVSGAAHGVVRTSALDRLPRLRVARVRVTRHGADLVVLDSAATLEELCVMRAPTILIGKPPPRVHRLRLDADLILPRGVTLRDCEGLRLSCPLLPAAALRECVPRRVADLSLKTGAYVMPSELPEGVRRFAFWAPSVILDSDALRRSADTLRVVEVHARHTIGSWSVPDLPPHVDVIATLEGRPVRLW